MIIFNYIFGIRGKCLAICKGYENACGNFGEEICTCQKGGDCDKGYGLYSSNLGGQYYKNAYQKGETRTAYYIIVAK